MREGQRGGQEREGERRKRAERDPEDSPSPSGEQVRARGDMELSGEPRGLHSSMDEQREDLKSSWTLVSGPF